MATLDQEVEEVAPTKKVRRQMPRRADVSHGGSWVSVARHPQVPSGTIAAEKYQQDPQDVHWVNFAATVLSPL